jgi:two-component system, chemotaxis family, protein-glutamate methylesterase/glutaminase
MTTEARRPAVELVALLASAGGLDPLSIVLRDLPKDFSAAVVVQQHLGGHSSVLPAILSGRTPHRVDWARDGQAVTPGHVLVCPPDLHMELTPGGSCRLREMETFGERRFDVLLASVADSYGPRGIGVVLSGSGRDGAEGTAAMKRAGAIVIAQSPGTAEYASMPIAAARAGADLVLPVREIGRVLVAIADGAQIPRPLETSWPTTSLEPSPINGNLTEGESMDAGLVTTARHNGVTPMPHFPALDGAAARAEAARMRIAELRRRREELAAGRGATAQTVATARRRAAESLRRAQQAHQAAAHAAARKPV